MTQGWFGFPPDAVFGLCHACGSQVAVYATGKAKVQSKLIKEDGSKQAVTEDGIIVDLTKSLPDEPKCEVEDYVGIQVGTDAHGVQISVCNDEENPGSGPAMTVAEQAKYDRLNAVVHRHKQSFYAMGCALRVILQEKLYRKKYRSFAQFCKEEHGFGRSHGYRLVEAADVVDEVSLTGDSSSIENLNQALTVKNAKQPGAEAKVTATKPKEEAANDGNILQLDRPAHLASFSDILKNAEHAHKELKNNARRLECLKLIGMIVIQLKAYCEWEQNNVQEAA